MTNANLFAKDYADDIVLCSRQGLGLIAKEDVREDMIMWTIMQMTCAEALCKQMVAL